MVTFYSALTLETESLMNFGLSGTNLGIFLVLVNLAVMALALFFAVDRYQSERQVRAQLETRVSGRVDLSFVWDLQAVYMSVCMVICGC